MLKRRKDIHPFRKKLRINRSSARIFKVSLQYPHLRECIYMLPLRFQGAPPLHCPIKMCTVNLFLNSHCKGQATDLQANSHIHNNCLRVTHCQTNDVSEKKFHKPKQINRNNQFLPRHTGRANINI